MEEKNLFHKEQRIINIVNLYYIRKEHLLNALIIYFQTLNFNIILSISCYLSILMECIFALYITMDNYKCLYKLQGLLNMMVKNGDMVSRYLQHC
jgi:hypothetical protein